MQERRERGYAGSSTGAVETWPRERSPDDWLGDVSDEDWSENAAERAERRRATPAYQGLPAPADDVGAEPTPYRSAPAGPVDVEDAHRAVIERRRLVAGLVVAAILGVAIVILLLLLRGGGEASQPTVTEPAATPPAPSESSPPPPPSPTPPASPSTTTPSTGDAAGFTLPEGTTLRLDEGDPAVVRELQQALTSAGYDPGPVDGTYGPRTEAAVVAFQQDNGLSADGAVGPETAAALNNAESTSPATPETTPSTTTPSTTTPSTTTPSTPGVSGFTLPEGTKLRVGEGDPAVVSELQQALTTAGYDPGSVDGTFGPKTEAAVVAFQQDNGLSADGVVGPDTASALNTALASG